MNQNKGSSRIPGFYNLDREKKLQEITQRGFLTSEDIEVLGAGLPLMTAENMIENVIGLFNLPLGIALNFRVNNRDVLVPMVVEEPSVVAGASFMAKLAREGGGFTASTTDPVMIGQLQLLDIKDPASAKEEILANKEQLLEKLADVDPVLRNLGGGPRDIEVRQIYTSGIGPFLVVHLLFDVRDAMGANVINTACEALAPELERLTAGRVHLRILSNLADRRLAKASCVVPVQSLAFDGHRGEEVRDGIIEAWAFADNDPYRAATHNKGIMNGIDAVVLATGNDWRAVEAGAHAYAARFGTYRSLSTWKVDNNGDLAGDLELPLAVGIVGGATGVHPGAKTNIQLLGVESAADLAEIIVSVGLAQNLAALRALATEGIQKGHMRLHARQIAITAGAEGDQISKLSEELIKSGVIRVDQAKEILKNWNK